MTVMDVPAHRWECKLVVLTVEFVPAVGLDTTVHTGSM
jgi:hypothetical protein